MSLSGLPHIKQCYNSRQVSHPAYPGLSSHAAWSNYLFETRSGSSISPDSCGTFGHAQNGIITPFGLFDFVRMSFGLQNTAQTFKHYMDKVLHGLTFTFYYIDDLLIASKASEEHKNHLCMVFKCLQNHGILINPSKCKLGIPQLQFLGHKINSPSIRPLPDKVQSVKEFPQPTTTCKIREFLGLVNFITTSFLMQRTFYSYFISC